MKRPREDRSPAQSEEEEEEEEEDIDPGSERVSPGHVKASFLRCGSPTTTTQVVARKKRRGVIEKRRRDRINGSLSELRRLVPTAFQKQGSAKLEKAEILQMTVDHLKVLQATGGKGYFDAHALALDFLSLGFRECVMEVSRYLSAVEGLDSGDPLRSRLLSHLASCSSQHFPLHHQPHQYHQYHQYHLQQQPHPLPHPFHPHHWAFQPAVSYGLSPDPEGGDPRRPVELSQRGVASSQADSTSSPSSSSSSSLSLSTSLLSLSASFPILPPSSFTSTTSPPISSSSSQTSLSSKPYRPWGTEVGAF